MSTMSTMNYGDIVFICNLNNKSFLQQFNLADPVKDLKIYVKSAINPLTDRRNGTTDVKLMDEATKIKAKL